MKARNSNYVFAVLALIGIAVFMLLAAVAYHSREGNRDNALIVHRLCSGARDAMLQDALAFESGDDARREEAYQRFYEGHAMYHSVESLQFCLDPKDIPEMPLRCELDKDWSCLAALARQIRTKL